MKKTTLSLLTFFLTIATYGQILFDYESIDPANQFSYNSQPLTTITNPDQTGENTTQNCVTYTSPNTYEDFGNGLQFNLANNIDFANGTFISFKMRASVPNLQIFFKLEDGAGGEVSEGFQTGTSADIWQTFEKDFTSSSVTVFDRVVIFVDQSSVALASAPWTVYFDEFIQATTLSTAEFRENLKEISIYPIPGNNQLNLKSNIEIKKIDVFNNLGAMVLTKSLDKQTNNLDISTLPSGVYFINIIADKGLKTMRFVKN